MVGKELILITNGEIEKKEKIVLEKINLKINIGDVIWLKGVNSSGKSVLSDVLIGFDKMFSGKFSSKVNKPLYITTEYPFFDEEKVKNVIDYYKLMYKIKKNKIEEIIDILDLRIHLKKRIKEISSGTKQKLKLIPLFILGYDFIILDEIFKTLDVNIKKIIEKQIIMQIENQATVVIIEHNEELMMNIKINTMRTLECKNKTVIEL